MAIAEVGELKIWQVTEIEWVAAVNAEDALKACREYYEQCYGKDAEQELKVHLEEFGNQPIASNMDRLKFTDDDGESRTFREELARRIASGDEFPQLFATSEY